jgi:tetratricopeptide (TPR) repeat protein
MYLVVADGSSTRYSPPVIAVQLGAMMWSGYDRIFVFNNQGKIYAKYNAAEISRIVAADPPLQAADIAAVLEHPEVAELLEKGQLMPEDRVAVGRAFELWGRPAAALPFLTQALQALPSNAYVHFYIGDCFEALNDMGSALKHYRQAVQLDSATGAPNPWFTRAVTRVESAVAR